MINDYIDRIINMLRRYRSVDLSIYEILIQVIFCDLTDNNSTHSRDFTRDFFVDRIEYLDSGSFTLIVASANDNLANYDEQTILSANIFRLPDGQKRLTVKKDNGMNPPFIPPLDLYLTMRMLECSVRTFDGDLLPTEIKSYFEHLHSEFVNDMFRYFDLINPKESNEKLS